MTPDAFIKNALSPALSLLPPKMDTQAARAMVVAICLQESRLDHRKQINGPARGYPQFELGGVTGVLNHPALRAYALTVCSALDYDPNPGDCYTAIAHNDILAAAFARLNLWWLPSPLPGRDSPDIGWAQYLQAWRPGQPWRGTWNAFYAEAWGLVS